MPRRWTEIVLIVGVLIPLAGCDALTEILLPTTVTVLLVNESPDYAVETTLFYDEDEDIFEIVLTEIGTEREDTIIPGGAVAFTRDCDDLGAIIIEDAELQALLIRPDADTGVLRLDDDFVCGDEIVFTFTHSELLVDFDVSITTR